MSQVTIPQLPPNAGLIGTELLEISNTGVSESISVNDLAVLYQVLSEKNVAFGYAGLDVAGEIDIDQLPMSIPASNIADSSVDNTEYQSLSGVTGPIQTQLNARELTANKNIANGYAGLDATIKLAVAQIPLLIPAINIADGTVENNEFQFLNGVTSLIQTQLNARELTANKNIANGYAGLNANVELDVTQIPLLIPAINIADGSIDNIEFQFLSGVTSAIQGQLDAKEEIINKNTASGYAGLDASTLLDVTQIPLLIPAVNIANGSVSNIQYQFLSGVTSPIQTQLNAKENTANKGTASGYAGLDANSFLLLANFPNGNALQVLRRNTANDALEFSTIDTGEIDSINGDNTPAQIFLAGTGLDIDNASETHTYSIDGTVVTLAGNQTLLNKTMNGSSNTFSNINETQQTVSVGAANTVLTSNGPGVAPTYQVGSQQSPWLDTIDANDQNLTDLKILTFASNGTLGPSDRTIFGTVNGMGLNVPANDAFTFAIASTSEFSISATQINCYNNQLIDAALHTGVSITDSLEWLENVRQTFNPGDNNAGINVGSNGTNPDAPQNGDLFYDSTIDVLKAYIDGAWVSFEASTISSISQLNTSISVADSGTNGLANFIMDGSSIMQMNEIRTALNHRFELNKAATISSFTAGVATLNNEGNLFAFSNINGNFSSLDTTNWQAGSIVYLQFPSADGTGVTLVHGAASSTPQASFWLLNEVNYTVNDSNFRQILSFIYDGTFWVQQSFGEVASSTATQTPWLSVIDGDRYTLDNAVIHFTDNPRAAPTSTEYAMYATTTTTPNALIINWPVNTELRMHVNGIEEYTFDNNLIQMHQNAIQDLSTIQDEHSNEQLTFAFVSDAVNHIKIINAATSNYPIFETDGDDDHIGLAIRTKGSGVVEVESDTLFDESVSIVKRLVTSSGSDVASATSITVGDGNYFKISGVTEIHFMSTIDWFTGSSVTLHFLNGLTIINQAVSTPPGFASFVFDADLVVTAGDTLTVTFDGAFWRRTSSTTNVA